MPANEIGFQTGRFWRIGSWLSACRQRLDLLPGLTWYSAPFGLRIRQRAHAKTIRAQRGPDLFMHICRGVSHLIFSQKVRRCRRAYDASFVSQCIPVTLPRANSGTAYAVRLRGDVDGPLGSRRKLRVRLIEEAEWLVKPLWDYACRDPEYRADLHASENPDRASRSCPYADDDT